MHDRKINCQQFCDTVIQLLIKGFENYLGHAWCLPPKYLPLSAIKPKC